MVILKTKCRICKKITNHEKVEEFDNLPEYVVCLRCMGCGVFGIVQTDETKAVPSE